jgi:DNA-binding transcriptional LysR family regulator
MVDRRRRLLALLPHLATLLAERHVSRAAERAGVTQPSMSRVLANARVIFDDDLLVRTRGGSRLTARGEDILEQLGSILRLVDSAWSPPAFMPELSQGVVRIAATDYVAQIYLAPLVARLRREAPGVTLEVSPWSADALRRIERDEVQLGMNPLVANAPGGFVRRRIGTDRYIAALAAAHPLAKRPGLALSDFVKVPHVITVTEDGAVGIVDRALRRRGQRRAVGARVKDFTTALALAGASDLIATVPKRLAAKMRVPLGLVLREPPVSLPAIEIDLIWHEGRQRDPMLSWLRAGFDRA